MELKNLMVEQKTAWIEYPGLDGFKVEVSILARDKIVAIRKSCMRSEFIRGSRTPVETMDEKKFVREFTRNVVKNWTGLKLSYLEVLMLVDIKSEDPNTELPYSEDNAELLVSNSGDFDLWLNDAVFDLENFRAERNGAAVETSGAVAE